MMMDDAVLLLSHLGFSKLCAKESAPGHPNLLFCGPASERDPGDASLLYVCTLVQSIHTAPQLYVARYGISARSFSLMVNFVHLVVFSTGHVLSGRNIYTE